MGNKEKDLDIEVRTTQYSILSISYLIILLALIGISIATEHDTVLICTSIAIGILVLLNLRYIIINMRKVKSVNILNNDVKDTDLHPLELYIIDCLWNHKKKRFTRNQVEAAILYEVTRGNLILTEKGVAIASALNLSEASVYTLITMEMSLLEKIDCRKIRRLKLNKLKTLQDEQVSIVMEDINSNITENCQDIYLFYEQSEEMKKNYFKDVESKKTVHLTLVSWIAVIATSLLAFEFASEASILNFYLPIGVAVILVSTLTSKYRERVTIRDERIVFISNAINYINYLTNAESSTINDIYAYCLGKVKYNKYSEIFKK